MMIIVLLAADGCEGGMEIHLNWIYGRGSTQGRSTFGRLEPGLRPEAQADARLRSCYSLLPVSFSVESSSGPVHGV